MLRKYAYILIGAILASTLFTACDEDSPIGGTDDIEITSFAIGDGADIFAEQGDNVRLDGSYFGLGEGTVTLAGPGITGSEALTIGSWSDVQVEFALPAALDGGLYTATITRSDLDATEDFQIYVGDTPMISSVVTVSVDASTVLVGWPMLGVESWDQFDKVVVTYMDAGSEVAVDVTDGTNQVFITGLDEGTPYEFSVKGMYLNGGVTNTVPKTWAAASRIPASGGVPILLFKSDNATQGSGLQMWDDLTSGPRVLTVSDGADWNLGIETKTPGEVYFGSAGFLDYTITPTNSAQLRVTNTGLTYTPADSLTSLAATPNEALDNYLYEEAAFDLNSLDLTNSNTGVTSKGVMLVSRIPNGSSFNYARIFIPMDSSDGDFLFTEGEDEHVRLYVSYQKEVGVPYAGK